MIHELHSTKWFIFFDLLELVPLFFEAGTAVVLLGLIRQNEWFPDEQRKPFLHFAQRKAEKLQRFEGKLFIIILTTTTALPKANRNQKSNDNKNTKIKATERTLTLQAVSIL